MLALLRHMCYCFDFNQEVFSGQFSYFNQGACRWVVYSHSCKLFHSMRYFFDNYLTYITLCLPKAKGFESAREGLSVVSERERQRRHYVR